MDRSAVQAWLDRYIAAWRSYDEGEIRSLFTSDARYRYHPYDPESDTLVGADAIAADWTTAQNRDAAGTYDAHYEPYAIDGDRAVAIGWSRYFTDASQSAVARIYDNVYLLRFDDEGRCAEFTELFMKRPDAAA